MARGHMQVATALLSALALHPPLGPAGSSAGQASRSMSQARTLEIMREYLTALIDNGPFADHFDENVVVSLEDMEYPIVGREAARQAITDFHQVAFAAEPELRTFTAGAGVAYAEMVFAARHTGEFFGIPATGKEVRVPYAAVWELAEDKITSVRLYGPASALVRQLSPAGASPTT